MRKLIFLLLPMMLTANCSEPSAQTVEPNPDKYFEPEFSDIVGANGEGNSINATAKPGDPLSPFNADGSTKQGFETETLLRLNAIMRRTKATIDKYDEVRPGIEKLIADAKAAPNDDDKVTKAREGLEEVRSLQAEAITSRKALEVEGQKLVDSGEYYDQVVFSGMATFVSRVETEFAEDIKAMREGLKI